MNATKLIITVIFLLIFCGLVIFITKFPAQSDTNINDYPQTNVGDVLGNECDPFYCYDDVSYIESKELISKADTINKDLRKFLTLISLNNFEDGTYTLLDVDKFALHSLIANNLFTESDYLILENNINNAMLSANNYEFIFNKLTGITDIKSYFSEYELKDIDNANRSVYMLTNDKVYYIVPFGLGVEVGISVISNVLVKGDKTLFSVKTYLANEAFNNYTYVKTTTFEIETNGLRVYNFKVEK